MDREANNCGMTGLGSYQVMITSPDVCATPPLIRSRTRRQMLRGFTLLELLIVLGIVTLLLQLMLPAILAAREAARRAQCQSNLRQIGVACHNHVNNLSRLPTGGWGFLWVGDPERGTDRRQPGGWIYNLLPYVEQAELYQLAAGSDEQEKRAAATRVCETPLSVFLCPSRRRTRLYKYRKPELYPLRNAHTPEYCAKSDYAANAGDHYVDGPPGPESLADADRPDYDWINRSQMTGVVFQRSELRLSHITDGTTLTYLVGEKYLEAEHYKDGHGGGDDQTMYVGYDQDVNRWTSFEGNPNPPLRDRPALRDWARFGSAHPRGCHFLMCDGSVRVVGYDIDGEVYRLMGNRHDGQRIPLETTIE